MAWSHLKNSSATVHLPSSYISMDLKAVIVHRPTKLNVSVPFFFLFVFGVSLDSRALGLLKELFVILT